MSFDIWLSRLQLCECEKINESSGAYLCSKKDIKTLG